jgi:hypothetical protein
VRRSVLTGHYWLQTVPDAHALVALDVTDAEHPREVSTVTFGDDEMPHWAAIDPTGRRVVVNSGGNGTGNRLFVVDFDPASGRLSMDERFRDAGSTRRHQSAGHTVSRDGCSAAPSSR